MRLLSGLQSEAVKVRGSEAAPEQLGWMRVLDR